MARTTKKPPEKPIDNTEPDPRKWPTRGETARLLGYSLSSIKRLEKEQKLIPIKDDDGVHRFDPGMIEGLRLELGGKPPPETEAVIASIDGATTHARDAGRHLERILGLVINPGESLLALYQATCKDLADEVVRWRNQHFELLTKLADMMKNQRQEDLEEKRLTLSDSRKDQALGLLKSAIPMIIAQAGGNKQLGHLLGFVHSLHPEQLRILLESGMLTQEQVSVLSQVLTADQKQALASQADTSDTETPAESTGDAPGNTGASDTAPP